MECEPKLLVSETLSVSIDISHDDEAVIQVSKWDGSRIEFVNTIRGRAALRLYEELTDATVKGCAEFIQERIDDHPANRPYQNSYKHLKKCARIKY